jgi:single-stranded DNA-binding protein
MNIGIIIGRLCNKPKVYPSTDGQGNPSEVLRFRVAAKNPGNKVQTFFNINVYNDQTIKYLLGIDEETSNEYVPVGSLIGIIGSHHNYQRVNNRTGLDETIVYVNAQSVEMLSRPADKGTTEEIVEEELEASVETQTEDTTLAKNNDNEIHEKASGVRGNRNNNKNKKKNEDLTTAFG